MGSCLLAAFLNYVLWASVSSIPVPGIEVLPIFMQDILVNIANVNLLDLLALVACVN